MKNLSHVCFSVQILIRMALDKKRWQCLADIFV